MVYNKRIEMDNQAVINGVQEVRIKLYKNNFDSLKIDLDSLGSSPFGNAISILKSHGIKIIERE